MKEDAKKYVELPIDELNPYEKNARTHSEEQIDKIIKSIQEFGFINPVIVSKDKMIIAGHGRVMAAKKMGMEKVPCLFVEHLSEAQMRAYVIADNKLAEDAGWDDEILRSELQELDNLNFDVSVTGFDLDTLQFDDVNEIEIKEDLFSLEPPEEPKAKHGQVWKLGGHRLMCGDSTNAEEVRQLMNGEQADLLETDPPYNVNYEGKTKDALTIENDSMSNAHFEEFLTAAFSNAEEHLKEGGAFYIWYAACASETETKNALNNTTLTVKQQLIWNKSVFCLGRQDYQWKHEPCMYGWKDGFDPRFVDVIIKRWETFTGQKAELLTE